MVTLAPSCHPVCGAGCSRDWTLPEGPTGTEQATSSGVSLSQEHTHVPADFFL